MDLVESSDSRHLMDGRAGVRFEGWSELKGEEELRGVLVEEDAFH